MNIYIIGASGLAREIANYVLDLETNYTLMGFIDMKPYTDNIQIRNEFFPVISEDYFLNREIMGGDNEKVGLLLGIGLPKIRNYVIDKFKHRYKFPNLIHPSSHLLDTSIDLGEGNIVAPNCVITTSVTIGNFNFFNIGVTIGHDVTIGNNNIFNPKVSISGNVKIGNNNFFGVHSCVIQGVNIGTQNIIGIGSSVIRNISNNTTLIGVPAQKIKV